MNEERTLRKLNRQARHEARRRASTTRRRSRNTPSGADTAGAGVGDNTDDTRNASAGRGAYAARLRSPFRRKLLKWLAIAVGAVVLLLVIFPPFLIPVDGPVTSRFSLRQDPESIFLFDIEHHRGIDFGAASGTPIRTPKSGRVVAVREDAAYGLMVDIRHPLGMVTRYGHLSAVDVREGRWLWRRQRVGRVGMTGRATGPHLHFEIRVGERSLPPGVFLVFDHVRRRILGID